MISEYITVKQIISIAVMVVLIGGCGKDAKTENLATNKIIPAIVETTDSDCVEFVALWAAADIAERIGRDKKWVFLNYTVDLWDKQPAKGVGNVVGKLRASSYARIIEKTDADYKVESPVNQAQGWISSEHVKAISMKNPKTNALCK